MNSALISSAIALPRPMPLPCGISLPGARLFRRVMRTARLFRRVMRTARLISLMADILTNAGRALVTSRLSGSAASLPQYLAWGTGSGTAAATDTTLFTEDTSGGYSRATATLAQVTTTVANDTLQMVGTLTATAALTITNGGMFNAPTGGTLFFKSDFTGIALSIGDNLALTFKLQMT